QSIHFWGGVAWLAALAAVVLLGGRRLLATARELDSFDSDDLRWLRGRGGPQGRFNAGQKINAILTAAFAVLFGVSGLLLWFGEQDTRFRFASTVILHDGLMYVSLVLLVGHLYLALINPATRHSLRGMTLGDVRVEWATRHHAKWEPEDVHIDRGTRVTAENEAGAAAGSAESSATTSARVVTPSFRSTEPTWRRTVTGATPSSPAISAVLAARRSNSTTSHSRAVSAIRPLP